MNTAVFKPGERVLVDIAAGIVPGVQAHAPDWQPGTVQARLPDGRYRIALDLPIAGRTAVKEAAPEHIRRLL